MNHEALGAAFVTQTIVESSSSLRDTIEKHAKKHEYGTLATIWQRCIAKVSPRSAVSRARKRCSGTIIPIKTP